MDYPATKAAILFAIALATAAGCDDNRTSDDTGTNASNPGTNQTDRTDRTDRTTTPTTPPSTTPAREPSTIPPPNVNPTDPSTTPAGSPSTPSQPANAERDKAITEEIRAIIRNDSSMSASAGNIDIVTRVGVVTLTGSVDTQAEKDTIEARAKQVSGVVQVVNNLEVQP
jgi:hypothetical protein